MKKLLMFGLSLALVSGLAISASAEGSSAPTEDIKMALTNEPVMFSHEEHLEEGIKCISCHHPVDGIESEERRKCSTAGCHDILGSKDKTVNSYYLAIHDRKSVYEYDTSCMKCHLTVVKADPDKRKELTSCKGSSCHP